MSRSSNLQDVLRKGLSVGGLRAKVVQSPLARPLKLLVKTFAPQPYDFARNAFWKLQERRRLQHLDRITQKWLGRHPRAVQSGPFVGMTYVEQAVGSALLPKLIGSYEQELHRVVQEIAGRSYRRIVDVGCAEGFYAVGLARLSPASEVLAYDINPEGRRLCQAMAEANGVQDRVMVREFCDPSTLEGLPEEPTLVISDCEGYELTLLDPAQAPRLKGFDILVELHDFAHAGLTGILRTRFSATHDIRFITSQPRKGSDYPVLDFLPPAEQDMAVNEYRRPGQQWAYMQSKAPFV